MYVMRTAVALMVMPRSRSRSMVSSICSRHLARADRAVISSSRSASVDLPWSMCAMMQKLRMRDWSMLRLSYQSGIRAGTGARHPAQASPRPDSKAARAHAQRTPRC